MSTTTTPTPAVELSEIERELFDLALAAGEIEKKTLSPGQMAAANELVERGVFVAVKVKGQRHVRAYSVAAVDAGIIDVTNSPAEALPPLEDPAISGRSFRTEAELVDKFIEVGGPQQLLDTAEAARIANVSAGFAKASEEFDAHVAKYRAQPEHLAVSRPTDNPTLDYDLAAAHAAGLPSKEESANWALTETARAVLRDIASGFKANDKVILQGLAKRGIAEIVHPTNEPAYYRPTAIGWGLAGLRLPAWREAEAAEYYRAFAHYLTTRKPVTGEAAEAALTDSADAAADEAARGGQLGGAGFYVVDIRPEEAVAVWFATAVNARKHGRTFGRGTVEVVSAGEYNERETAGSLLDRRNLTGVSYRVATSLETDQPHATSAGIGAAGYTAGPAPKPAAAPQQPAAPAAEVGPNQLSLVLTGDEVKDEILIASKLAAGWVIGALDLLKQDVPTQKVVGRMINKKLIVSQHDLEQRRSIYSLSPAGQALVAAKSAPASAHDLPHFTEVRQAQNLAAAGLVESADDALAHSGEPAFVLDAEAKHSDGREGRPTPHDYLLKLAPTLTEAEQSLALAIGYGGRRFDALTPEQSATAAGLCRKGAVTLASATGGPINKYIVATGLPEILRNLNSQQLDSEIDKFVETYSTPPVAEEHSTTETLVLASEVDELTSYQRDLILTLAETPDLITRAAKAGKYSEPMFEAVELFVSAGWLNTYRGAAFDAPTEAQFTDRGRAVVAYAQQHYAAERVLFVAHFTATAGPVAEPVGEGPAQKPARKARTKKADVAELVESARANETTAEFVATAKPLDAVVVEPTPTSATADELLGSTEVLTLTPPAAALLRRIATDPFGSYAELDGVIDNNRNFLVVEKIISKSRELVPGGEWQGAYRLTAFGERVLAANPAPGEPADQAPEAATAEAIVAEVDVVTARIGSVAERGYDEETRDRILQLLANSFKMFIGESIPDLLVAIMNAGVEVSAWYDPTGPSEVRVFLSTTEKSFGVDLALADVLRNGVLLKTLGEMADAITFDRPFDPFVITREGPVEEPHFTPLRGPINLERFASSVAVFHNLTPPPLMKPSTPAEEGPRIGDRNTAARASRESAPPRPMSPDPVERAAAEHWKDEPAGPLREAAYGRHVRATASIPDEYAANPPAFPAEVELGPGQGTLYSPGISRRLYLAAHAPAKIPAWFKPDGDRPVEPADLLESALAKVHPSQSPTSTEAVRELLDDEREYYAEAGRKWDVRRCGRWPLYWADLVLAESQNPALK